eukprot:g2478.t1
MLDQSLQSGKLSGGDEFEIEFANWPVISSTTDVAINFGASPGQVTAIKWSDGIFGSTRLSVRSPAMDTPGTVSVELTDSTASVYFDFNFVDDNVELWFPGGPLCSNSPAPGYCLQGPTLSGTNAGGVVHTLVIKNFPANEPAADEIAVTIGDALGAIQYVNTTRTAGGASLLQVQFVTPQYADATINSAESVVAAQIFLLAEPSSSAVGFDYTYRTPVAPLSVTFGASYTRLQVLFNQPTDGDVNGQRVACHTLLDNVTISQIGEGAMAASSNCLWDTPSSLFILLGRGYNVRLLTPIAFKARTLKPVSSANDDLALASSVVNVQDDESAALPEAKVVAPMSLGFCDALALDGSGSSGIGLTYAWSCSNCDAAADEALLQLLPSISDARAVISSDVFGRANTEYRFSLVVTDFVGRESTPGVASVVRSSLSLPQIAIDGPSAVNVDARDEVTIGAFAEFSACAEAQQLQFSWTQIRAAGDLAVQFESRGRLLRIVAGALSPAQTYHFEVTGFPTNNPQNRGTARVTITTVLPPLVAIIDGGDRTVPSALPVTLDGSRSADPSGYVPNTGLKFAWTCSRVGSSLPCRTKNNTMLTLSRGAYSAAAVATLFPNTLPGGQYTFGLTVSTQARSASTALTITVVERIIPVVSLTKLLPARESETVNAGEMIVVRAVSSDPTVTWEWTIDPPVDISSPAIAPLGTSMDMFVLNPGVLSSGSRSVLTVTATKSADEKGSAQQQLYVNLPPTSGQCSIATMDGSAAAGTSMETEFTVSCNGWVDDSPGELLYSFAYVDDATNEKVPLQALSRANSKPNFVLPAAVGDAPTGDITVIATIADSLGATATWQGTVVITDKFSGQTGAALTASVGQLLDTKVEQAKQKGDAGGALNMLSNSAQVVSAGTLEAVAGCLRKVSLLSDTLGVPQNATHNDNDLFASLDLLALCASKNDGAQMSMETATHFVSTMGSLMAKPVVDIVATGGNEVRDDVGSKFSSTYSAVRTELNRALLPNIQVSMDPFIVTGNASGATDAAIAARGASLRVQKVTQAAMFTPGFNFTVANGNPAVSIALPASPTALAADFPVAASLMAWALPSPYPSSTANDTPLSPMFGFDISYLNGTALQLNSLSSCHRYYPWSDASQCMSVRFSEATDIANATGRKWGASASTDKDRLESGVFG